MATPMVTYGVQVSIDLASRIERKQNETGKNKSQVIREALALGLDKVEKQPVL